ncbi:MAG: trypsin-like serine peptidase, partial [Casimicrobiaceae bacterium]
MTILRSSPSEARVASDARQRLVRRFACASASLAVVVLAVSAVTASAQVSERRAADPLAAFPLSSDIGRAPPARVEAAKVAAAPTRFALSGEPALRFDAEPLASAQERLKRATATVGENTDRRKIARIGYPRELALGSVRINGRLVPWQVQADGRRLVGASFDATLAAGMRIHYAVHGAPMTLRFAGSGRDEVYEVTPPLGEPQWSPVLEGDRARVELELAPGIDPARVEVEFIRLSHLEVAGASVRTKRIGDIGDSGSCNIDIACVSNPSFALLEAARSVAKMIFSDGSGTSYLCTGTLMNSVPSTGVPYLVTAAHCIDNQAFASSLNTYWFFDAVACESLAAPPFELVTGGAALLATDVTLDITLLRLNRNPPTGAVFSAWNATIVPRSTNVMGLHHPSGDLKKFSQGASGGYVQGPAQISNPPYGLEPNLSFGYDSYLEVSWRDGTTEAGSSGSGIFTYIPTATTGYPDGYYELRGVLSGGNASCSNPTGRDRYGRLDLMFSKLAPYLQPSAIAPASDATTAIMVEFYNPRFDYYFMTSRNGEKEMLDTYTEPVTGNLNGVPTTRQNQTFYRTGYWFKTDAAPSSTFSPLTRY